MTGSLRLVDGDGPEDPVDRRKRFEVEHPEAVILPPSPSRWRAVVDGRILGDYELAGLMDQLEALYRGG